MKCLVKKELEVFNLLEHPVWVFDFNNGKIWWANNAAVHLWNAESLEALQKRDFTQMSDTSRRRLEGIVLRLQTNERLHDSWTFYPNGQGPKSVYLTLREIHIDNGKQALLIEADLTRSQDSQNKYSIRASEMLKYQPVPLTMFDSKGRAIHQNPEAVHVFGGREEYDQDEDEDHRNGDRSNTPDEGCCLLARFVDRKEGKKVLDSVMLDGKDFSGEIEQRTKTGIRWFTVQLRRSMDPIKAIPIVLYSARDISALIEAKNSMVSFEKAKNEADAALKAKSEFVAVMAHEMRTPLHQVLGFIDLLKGTILTKAQQNYLNLAETSASALMVVVNDLLDFTKLEAGKMKMEQIPMDPYEVAMSSLNVTSSTATQKGLSIHSAVGDKLSRGVREFPAVMGDPSRLRQILLNLFSNAVKFTKDGEISLEVERLPDDDRGRVVLSFTVADTGIGIHPDHQEIVFNKYQQADSSISRHFGGTGLGLAICKIIVDTLGGEIGVDSVLGEGSRFWFRLPFEKASNFGVDHPKSSFAAKKSKALHILVAEDNKINQKLVAALLKRLGHTSTVVENGRLAVSAVEEGTFDLVLMDIQMPDMDGYEATRRIRENGWTCEKLPVLGLTADYRISEHGKYHACGMNDCLGKPIRIDDLSKCLTAYY